MITVKKQLSEWWLFVWLEVCTEKFDSVHLMRSPLDPKTSVSKKTKIHSTHKSFYIFNSIELHQTYFLEKPYSEHVVASMSCLHFMVTNFTFCRIMTMKEGLPSTHVCKINLDPLWCPKTFIPHINCWEKFVVVCCFSTG